MHKLQKMSYSRGGKLAYLLSAAVAVLAGTAAMAETPDSYLDYVRADGTQYFDTGVIGKAYTKAEIDFHAEAMPKHGSYIFGSQGDSGNKIVAPWYYNYGTGAYYDGAFINCYGHPCEYARFKFVSTLEPKYQVVYWYDTGVTYPTNGPNTQTYAGSTGQSMYLFALNNNGTPQLLEKREDKTYIGLRLYGLKVWQKDSAEGEYSLVRDYRPAVKSGKVGLYDDVNKTIIYPKAADGSETTIGPRIRYVYSTNHDGMTPTEQLTNVVATTESGDIVILERGTYTFPDDVYMADNLRDPTSNPYCKIRLNLTKGNITFRGEDASGRETWTHGSEPVIIEGNGAKALQIAIPNAESVRIENITFANCFGGHNSPNNETSGGSAYGNYCAGGAIGIGRFNDHFNGSSNVTITNCVFRGNRAAIGGAIGSNGAVSCTVQDCFFTNNVAESSGGGMYSGKAYGCDFIDNSSGIANAKFEVRNCRFISNCANGRGSDVSNNQPIATTATVSGASDTIADSVFVDNSVYNWSSTAKSSVFSNCHFTNNFGISYGVVSANNGVVTNCSFHSNTNGNQNQGTITDAKLVVNCRLTCNHGIYGGGVHIATTNRAKQVRTYVKDCYFGGNDSGNGGGAASLTYKLDFQSFSAEDLQEPLMTFDHCTFETNFTGGGADGGAILCAVTNLPAGVARESLVVCSNGCIFAGNTARYGGGVMCATVIGGRFLENRSPEKKLYYMGTDAAYSRLIDCELTGGNVWMSSLDRCYVHDVTNVCVFNNGCHVTNTLVYGCVTTNDAISAVISRYGDLAQEQFDFVNCTFVANKGNFFSQTNLINMVNCAFFYNTNSAGTATAISYRNASDNNGNTTFDHCAFGPIVDGALPLYPLDGVNYTGVSPRFVAARSTTEEYEGEPYYEPLPSSPLRSRGLLLGFTESDTDLAGRSRVRDGRVDIGCYQCWLNPIGFMLMFR